ncbi:MULTISPECIES: DUF3099 domain-containing protein [unclassified Corynebacterium]|nr:MULTISPECIES: DUF3099 domain-containing protein [unclassified Corynebacterium]
MAVARKRKTGGESRSRRVSQVEVITDAKSSPLEGWHHRRRVYTVLQILRIPLLAASAVVMLVTHNAALAVGVAVISIPLPWIAVLLANETGQVDETTNKVYKPALVREQRRAQRAALSGESARPMIESTESAPQVIDHLEAPDSPSD